jgi:hypothetical protein
MTNEKTPAPVTKDAPSQVSGPATGLLVAGILGAVIELTSLIALIIGTSFYSFIENEMPDKYEGLFEGTIGIGSSFVGLLVAAFIIFISLKMKELKEWGLCVAASILAMIPCISPCCIIGLPIGIWCLVVLTKPEVKAAFK